MSMSVKRNLKKFLVFTLAFILDQYQEISVRNFYRALYFPGGYPKRESLHRLVHRMVKVKQIEKKVIDGEVYIKLTSKSDDFFNEKISLKKLSQRNWDGLWRLVIFDIKEIERGLRDNLRRKLKEWGFAMWQESVYISPHPILSEINEFLKTNRLFPKVVTMESKILGVKNYDRFAWAIFNLGELERRYLEINKKILDLKDNKKNREKIREILEDFQKAVLTDPFLPKRLIKENWLREEIRKKIKNLIEEIEM